MKVPKWLPTRYFSVASADRFSPQFKRRILKQASACENHGELAALLRKHGLYSSRLSQWRALFAEGGRGALVGKVAGRKPRLDPKDRRIVELERDNAKLTARLELSEKVVAFQKKRRNCSRRRRRRRPHERLAHATRPRDLAVARLLRARCLARQPASQGTAQAGQAAARQAGLPPRVQQ